VQVAPGTVLKPCSSGASLTVLNHMRLDGALWLGLPAGGSSTVTFSGDQTLDGQGEAKFVSNTSANALAPAAGTTLTLGGSVLVHGRAGRIGLAGSPLVNRTTVAADTSGTGFTIAGSPWRSEGTVRADRGAGNLTCSTPFVNVGVVTVDSARTFSFLTSTGTYAQTAGVTTLRKGTITISAPTGLEIQGGTLQGIGTISGGLNNGGQVLPGLSPGALSITGKYTQADNAALRVEIAGTSTSQYDRLLVSDRALLRGTLQVSLINSFTPSLGDSFVIVQYSSGQGLFPQLDLPPLGSGLGWRVRYRPTLLSLTVSNTTDVGENEPPDAGLTVPIAFWVYPAKPNPFNPTTRIRFDMPQPAVASLLIYNSAGRVVRRLLHRTTYVAGRHTATWDGRDDAGRGVASGVYAYRFQAGGYAATRRMVLVK
jgi:hypothetical protein